MEQFWLVVVTESQGRCAYAVIASAFRPDELQDAVSIAMAQYGSELVISMRRELTTDEILSWLRRGKTLSSHPDTATVYTAEELWE